ncbi:uncharacterized protein EDB91DRAFT_1246331 [Suillus paluster]|uniref:uncharacterized protein n=1 Tax=Suillus paluster TaxID=48578 RepID=UPI001B86E5A2|nr:uncharacterized protein EDB91DRAFT_1246331 [Suillus paluster]KAG1745457.1 hypothetical protein EDB91DRAFT_1246331 [Suillus paluster]
MSQTGTQASHLRHEPIGLCIPCTKPGCNRWFKNRLGHTQHMNAKHPVFLQQLGSTQPCRPHSPSSGLPDTTNLGDTGAMEFSDNKNPMQPMVGFCGTGDQLYRNYHPFLSEGNFLPPGTPPPPLTDKMLDDWTPYKSRVEFQLTDYLFTKNQTPVHLINQLLDIWAASLMQAGSRLSLFSDHHHIYKTIDNTPLGNVKWQSFTVKYTGEILEKGAAPWMVDSHKVWFCDPHKVICNMLSNPDFAVEIDLRPYQKFAMENDERQWKDFMSGDWAYKQANMISEDPDTHGSMFVPVILRSNKTTVLVTTGQNDYYPLYVSIGNVWNNGFSQCPKALDETTLLCSRLHVDVLIEECNFDTLWAEYGIVSVLMPFTNDFPHADIHELLAPDLLHQIIKGSFKDHLVEWVERYLLQEHRKTQANIILDDIDRWIAVVPPFPGLHWFPQGRHFKQWTSDDSKALMKVYLPAIEGYVPEDVVCAFSAFLKFCYLVHHNILMEKSLEEIQAALAHFHQYREVFKTTGMITMFSLP